MKKMKFKVIFADIKMFDRLDNSVRQQINNFLRRAALQKNPRSYGKQLQYNLGDYWCYRVGSYRLIAEIKDEQLIVLIVKIDKRDKVYKR